MRITNQPGLAALARCKEGIEVGNKEGNNKIIHFVAKAFYCFYGKVFMVFIWAHSAYNFISLPEFPMPQSH